MVSNGPGDKSYCQLTGRESHGRLLSSFFEPLDAGTVTILKLHAHYPVDIPGVPSAVTCS